ncbi:unnamed protein product [Paramecium primaurelia]|uniref:Transmembrane protein n=1 Tax=Paramecium primaurelia TaxID=5886 RepID=A0A8S1PED0_PARPR|nr:unnamed protein product [Paramecium primaurelia]
MNLKNQQNYFLIGKKSKIINNTNFIYKFKDFLINLKILIKNQEQQKNSSLIFLKKSFRLNNSQFNILINKSINQFLYLFQIYDHNTSIFNICIYIHNFLIMIMHLRYSFDNIKINT